MESIEINQKRQNRFFQRMFRFSIKLPYLANSYFSSYSNSNATSKYSSVINIPSSSDHFSSSFEVESFKMTTRIVIHLYPENSSQIKSSSPSSTHRAHGSIDGDENISNATFIYPLVKAVGGDSNDGSPMKSIQKGAPVVAQQPLLSDDNMSKCTQSKNKLKRTKTDPIQKDFLSMNPSFAHDSINSNEICGRDFSIKEGSILKISSISDGTTFQYKIGRMLGKGSFGEVIHGLNEAGQEVAIKIIPIHVYESLDSQEVYGSESKLIRRECDNEIEIHSSLDHPNIVKLFASFSTKSCYFMVLELLKCGPVGKDEVTKRWDEIGCARVIRDVASALQYCHSKGIVHRDVKLANILLSEDGTAKLADFGLSSKFSGTELLMSKVGTDVYMAPEVGREEYGVEVDMYSLGVMMHMMLFQTLPRKKWWAFGRVHIANNRNIKVGKDAKRLLRGLLKCDPNRRLTASDVLKHPWITNLNV